MVGGFVGLYIYLCVFVDLLDVSAELVLKFVSGCVGELDVLHHFGQLLLQLLQLLDVRGALVDSLFGVLVLLRVCGTVHPPL